MKISELIEKLKQLPDQESDIKIAIGSYTQVYPSAYVTPHEVTSADGGRIYVNLPEGFYIGERRKAIQKRF